MTDAPHLAVIRCALAWLVVLAASLTAPAAGQDAGAAPEPDWIPMERIVLDNGVTVVTVRRPYADTVFGGWVVRAGGADDPEARSGVAHLVEHLLFQGSHTIGTRDWPREQALFEERARLLDEGTAGESVARLERIERELAALQRPGELARLWAEGGIVSGGALTTKDFSFYVASFPAQRLEAWLWLESDRIRQPALRGLRREKRVVAEESLQRVDSVDRAAAEIAFDRHFWGSSPYAEPTDGEEGELERLRRADALRFHGRHYHGGNLAFVLVGDLDAARVAELARRYLGRIPGAPSLAAESPAAERWAAQPAGDRFEASCDCRPSVRLRFPSVPYGSPEAVGLDVLAAVLNGRSGRLHLGLVNGRDDVYSSYATHKAQARAGAFTVVAEAMDPGADGRTLDRLGDALGQELARIAEEGLRELELERARRILLADAAREIKPSEALRTRLLIDHALGDGERLARWQRELAEVGPEDVRRLVRELLAPERAVRFVLRRGSGGPGQ